MNICDEKKLNKINFIKQNNTNPDRPLRICRGYLFVYSGAFLSVGETCGLPRANTVLPYHVLVKEFAISPLILQSVGSAFLLVDYFSLEFSERLKPLVHKNTVSHMTKYATAKTRVNIRITTGLKGIHEFIT